MILERCPVLYDNGKVGVIDHGERYERKIGPKRLKENRPAGAVSIRHFSASDGLNVTDGDLASTAVFLGIEGDFLAFDEATHSGALERGGMDKHVLAAIIGLNEAEAFLVVVELHGALIHKLSFR